MRFANLKQVYISPQKAHKITLVCPVLKGLYSPPKFPLQVPWRQQEAQIRQSFLQGLDCWKN